jgi:hypothetical protein
MPDIDATTQFARKKNALLELAAVQPLRAFLRDNAVAESGASLWRLALYSAGLVLMWTGVRLSAFGRAVCRRSAHWGRP